MSITLGGTPRSGEFSRVGWLLFGWERPADAKGGGSGPPNPAATPPHMSRACRKRKARDPSRAAGSGRSAVLTGGRSDPRNRAHRNLARPSCRTEVARGGGRVLPPLPLDGRASAAGMDEDVGEDVGSRGVSEQRPASPRRLVFQRGPGRRPQDGAPAHRRGHDTPGKHVSDAQR